MTRQEIETKRLIEMYKLTPEQRLFRIKHKSENFNCHNFATLALYCAISKAFRTERMCFFRLFKWLISKSQFPSKHLP